MKKLMIMAAVAFVAVASQAAVAVTWNSGLIKKPNADGSMSTSNLATADAFTATIAFFTDSACTTPFAAAGGTLSTSTVATKGTAGYGGTTDTSGTFGAGTYYAVLTLTGNVGGKDVSYTSDVGSFTIADGALNGPTINFTSGLNMGGSSLMTATKWTVAGVPEPTSGILMLVGLGALALRRRKA